MKAKKKNHERKPLELVTRDRANRFTLERDVMIGSDEATPYWMPRAEITQMFRRFRGTKETSVTYYFKGSNTPRLVMAQNRVGVGVEIGCCSFSMTQTTKLRKWSGLSLDLRG